MQTYCWKRNCWFKLFVTVWRMAQDPTAAFTHQASRLLTAIWVTVAIVVRCAYSFGTLYRLQWRGGGGAPELYRFCIFRLHCSKTPEYWYHFFTEAILFMKPQQLNHTKSTLGRKFHPETFTKDEVMALVEANNGGVSGLRNKVLFIVLWRCGLRVSEVVGLRYSDYNASEATLRVIGKGGAFLTQWPQRGSDYATRGVRFLLSDRSCLLDRDYVFDFPLGAGVAERAF